MLPAPVTSLQHLLHVLCLHDRRQATNLYVYAVILAIGAISIVAEILCCFAQNMFSNVMYSAGFSSSHCWIGG